MSLSRQGKPEQGGGLHAIPPLDPTLSQDRSETYSVNDGMFPTRDNEKLNVYSMAKLLQWLALKDDNMYVAPCCTIGSLSTTIHALTTIRPPVRHVFLPIYNEHSEHCFLGIFHLGERQMALLGLEDNQMFDGIVSSVSQLLNQRHHKEWTLVDYGRRPLPSNIEDRITYIILTAAIKFGWITQLQSLSHLQLWKRAFLAAYTGNLQQPNPIVTVLNDEGEISSSGYRERLRASFLEAQRAGDYFTTTANGLDALIKQKISLLFDEANELNGIVAEAAAYSLESDLLPKTKDARAQIEKEKRSWEQHAIGVKSLALACRQCETELKELGRKTSLQACQLRDCSLEARALVEEISSVIDGLGPEIISPDDIQDSSALQDVPHSHSPNKNGPAVPSNSEPSSALTKSIKPLSILECEAKLQQLCKSDFWWTGENLYPKIDKLPYLPEYSTVYIQQQWIVEGLTPQFVSSSRCYENGGPYSEEEARQLVAKEHKATSCQSDGTSGGEKDSTIYQFQVEHQLNYPPKSSPVFTASTRIQHGYRLTVPILDGQAALSQQGNDILSVPTGGYTDVHCDNGIDNIACPIDCVKLCLFWPPLRCNLQALSKNWNAPVRLLHLMDQLQGGGKAILDCYNGLKIPAGWLHAVITIAGGRMATANFINRRTVRPLCYWIQESPQIITQLNSRERQLLLNNVAKSLELALKSWESRDSVILVLETWNEALPSILKIAQGRSFQKYIEQMRSILDRWRESQVYQSLKSSDVEKTIAGILTQLSKTGNIS